ncbi:MAG: hypothetical protein K0S44_586 [Bacteroidetes bacterium]|jgi:gliding motility-associated-like protein|nr:hypothetical protein [Bacteroidota bacterium]
MKKIILLIIMFFFVRFWVNAQTADFLWAKRIGGSYYDVGNSITVDVVGNVYTTGLFQGTVDFDPNEGVYNLTASGQDGFVSKFNSSGDFQWAKRICGNFGFGQAIVIDGSGNVCLTGGFLDTADFDPGLGVNNLISSGVEDIYISKLDSLGNLLWAKRIGSTSTEKSYSIASDAEGNIYTTGYFSSPVDFDPGPGVYALTPGNSNAFICKLDNSGAFVWAKSIGGSTSWNSGQSVAVDAIGNVYTTGFFEYTTDFDPGPGVYNLTSEAWDFDIFLSKLDSSGNFIWAKKMGGTGIDYGLGIAVDSDANIYTTGFFQGTADFDPGNDVHNLVSPGPSGSSDVFISKLNSSGDFVWAKSLGGITGGGMGLSITVDVAKNVYTAGFFGGIVDFDPGVSVTNLSSTGRDIFISKLYDSGDFAWAKNMGGGSGQNNGYSVAVDINFNVYAIGCFYDTVDFDPGIDSFNLISAGLGTPDVFVMKLGNQVSSGIPEEANFNDSPNIFTPNNDGINDLFIINNLTQGSIVKIYNRWGIEVISTNSEVISNSGWDGRTITGVECVSGVYFYTVNLQNDKIMTGFVQLFR